MGKVKELMINPQDLEKFDLKFYKVTSIRIKLKSCNESLTSVTYNGIVHIIKNVEEIEEQLTKNAKVNSSSMINDFFKKYGSYKINGESDSDSDDEISTKKRSSDRKTKNSSKSNSNNNNNQDDVDSDDSDNSSEDEDDNADGFEIDKNNDDADEVFNEDNKFYMFEFSTAAVNLPFNCPHIDYKCEFVNNLVKKPCFEDLKLVGVINHMPKSLRTGTLLTKFKNVSPWILKTDASMLFNGDANIKKTRIPDFISTLEDLKSINFPILRNTLLEMYKHAFKKESFFNLFGAIDHQVLKNMLKSRVDFINICIENEKHIEELFFSFENECLKITQAMPTLIRNFKDFRKTYKSLEKKSNLAPDNNFFAKYAKMVLAGMDVAQEMKKIENSLLEEEKEDESGKKKKRKKSKDDLANFIVGDEIVEKIQQMEKQAKKEEIEKKKEEEDKKEEEMAFYQDYKDAKELFKESPTIILHSTEIANKIWIEWMNTIQFTGNYFLGENDLMLKDIAEEDFLIGIGYMFFRNYAVFLKNNENNAEGKIVPKKMLAMFNKVGEVLSLAAPFDVKIISCSTNDIIRQIQNDYELDNADFDSEHCLGFTSNMAHSIAFFNQTGIVAVNLNVFEDVKSTVLEKHIPKKRCYVFDNIQMCSFSFITQILDRISAVHSNKHDLVRIYLCGCNYTLFSKQQNGMLFPMRELLKSVAFQSKIVWRNSDFSSSLLLDSARTNISLGIQSSVSSFELYNHEKSKLTQPVTTITNEMIEQIQECILSVRKIAQTTEKNEPPLLLFDSNEHTKKILEKLDLHMKNLFNLENINVNGYYVEKDGGQRKVDRLFFRTNGPKEVKNSLTLSEITPNCINYHMVGDPENNLRSFINFPFQQVKPVIAHKQKLVAASVVALFITSDKCIKNSDLIIASNLTKKNLFIFMPDNLLKNPLIFDNQFKNVNLFDYKK